MKLILLGPPGCGKGTQAVFLHEELRVPSISTGHILREACQKKTKLGLKADAFISKGSLVPDEIVVGIVQERLARDDCQRGFILDGFPRTIGQAESLRQFLNGHGPIDAVVNFDVEDVELVHRLTGRRQCRACGAGVHVTMAPPRKEGICDRCGGKLYQRSDDSEETIRNRLKVYREQTAPLVEYYRGTGLLKSVAGVGKPEDVFGTIAQNLKLKSS